MKKKVFLLYPFYWPFYKAGGPVQSIYNIAGSLSANFDFYIVSKNSDIDGAAPKRPLKVGVWQQGIQGERIYYSSWVNFFLVSRLIFQIKPDVVMVNGIFNLNTTIPGILLSHFLRYKLIISPRGMLQAGALAMRPFKKNIFLLFLKSVRLCSKAIWHATDMQEEIDIKRNFGSHSHVKIVSNIPRPPRTLAGKSKSSGPLRMIYLSLVTAKKGLHTALKSLEFVDPQIIFHIYGPISDNQYWKRCLSFFGVGGHEIKYMGPVEPEDIQQKLALYDVMILPTRGENFGHSIYESLSAGTPVLISPKTPWGILQASNAGITIDSFDPKDWAMGINSFIRLNEEHYELISSAATHLAYEYYSNGDFVKNYTDLFD